MALSNLERDLFTGMLNKQDVIIERLTRVEEKITNIEAGIQEKKLREKAVFGGIASVISGLVSFVVGWLK